MDKEALGKIGHLWCQHCKALQRSNNTAVECLYNPLNSESPAFCAANEDAAEEILGLLLPKDKPPLLSDGEIYNVKNLKYNPDMDEAELFMVALKGIAEAQREIDIKHYEH